MQTATSKREVVAVPQSVGAEGAVVAPKSAASSQGFRLELSSLLVDEVQAEA